MAHVVTKRIKGRDYQYAVESYHDPETKRAKSRWTYLGVVEGDGVVRSPERRSRTRPVREEIVAATARLLAFRDPQHITVDVIASTAGVSHSTFYRHFRNQQEAMNGAIALVFQCSFRALPPLPQHAPDDGEARRTLRNWCFALYESIGHHRALHRILMQTDRKKREPFDPTLIGSDLDVRLASYLRTAVPGSIGPSEDARLLAQRILRTVCTTRLSTILASDFMPSLPKFDDVYPLIERAVFGA